MAIREKDGADRLNSAEAWAARKALLARQFGYFTESFDLGACPTTGAAIATGTPLFAPLPLLKGDPVTNLIVQLATLGSSLTLGRMSLYRVAPGGATGTQIANTLTGDLTNLFQSPATVGPQVCPLTTPYVSPDDEVVYVGLVAVGTTGPALMRQVSNPVFRVIPGAQLAPCCKGAGGATDLRASETFTYASTSMSFWVAAS